MKNILNKSVLSVIGLSTIGLIGGSYISDAFFTNTLSLEDNTVVYLSFDKNLLQEDISKEIYSSLNNNFSFKEGKKNNGISLNRDSFTIPDVISKISNKDKITVSFWINYGGDDNSTASEYSKGIIPISFGEYNLWIRSECIGFNTSSNDVYGVENNLKLNEWNHIIAEFNKGDVKKNRLIINGVEQTLSQQLGTSNNSKTNINNLTIGAWTNRTVHTIQNSILDEIIIYDKSLTSSEIQEVQKQHTTPELRGETTSYPKLSWATELLPEDTIYQTGFEVGDDINGTAYTNCTNVVTEEKFLGQRSLRVRNSVQYGNNGHGDGTVSARYDFNTVYGLKSGMKFTASVKIKSIEDRNISIAMASRGTSVTKTSTPWHSVFGGVPIIVGEDTANTPGRIVIENFDDFYNRLHNTNMNFIANKIGTNYDAYRITVYKKQVDTNTKSITGMPSNISYKKGDVLQWIDTAYPLSLSAVNVSNDGSWHSYNFNGVAPSSENYDIENRGILPYINFRNNKDVYIDEIKFGHATKVRLYRDNNLIYEGYEAQFNDTSSTDKVAPTTVSNIVSNMEMINSSTMLRKLTIQFDASQDLASVYNYQVSGISKDGTETPKSNTLPLEVNSGLKGYSYIIDENSTTIPDNTVDTTSTTITKDITDSGVYYIHIKAIDNNGNVSGTIHRKIDIPTLTAKDNAKEDLIRLDWTMGDVNNKTFKVYQKKPGSSEFQSISMTNLDTSKKVRVLNIYPTLGFQNKTNGNLDIAGKVEKTSAVLTDWMVGYDKGALDIKSLNKEDFEANPDKYLKDENGEYVFDVIAYGFGNIGNGSATISYPSQHLNSVGVKAISDFIDAGRGVLASHHTIGLYNFNQGLNLLKEKFNVKLFKESNAPGLAEGNVDVILEDTINWSGHRSYYWSCSNQVVAVKKGALLNYPHDIAQEGKVFNIPHSHSGWAFIMGDNWFEYNNAKAHNLPDVHIGSAPDDSNFPDLKPLTYLNGSSGTNNSYLSTWNNTAIIQTGHSGNIPTDDERKILANTLFYLNQQSTDNFLDDYSGQNVTAPNKPVIYGHNFTEDGFININFNSVTDNGSEYSYYVESQTKDNDSLTLSNVVTETITSGMKGYSYIIDSSPSTIPDNEIEQTTNETIKIKTNNNSELYVHIKAIDNVGNASETYHYRITDITKPTLILSLAPNTWTNGLVTINATAIDNGSGLKYIILPNGNMLKATNATYTVIQNGIYYFKAVDYMGNETISSINVSNIDKKNPTVTITNNQNWTNQDVQVNITATDE